MKITRLIKNMRGKKIAVHLDGRYSFSVEEYTIAKEGLFIGEELDSEAVEKVISTDIAQNLKERVIKLLARRPRSVKEVRDYLSTNLQRRAPSGEKKSDIIENIIDDLTERRYLDDKDFARWWVRNRNLNKGKSKQEMRSELGMKGISLALIERILKEESNEGTELEILKRVVAKKREYYKMKSSSEQEYNKRLHEYLLRRGFSWELIKKITNIF